MVATYLGANDMAQSISLSVEEVRCGLPGTLVIVGRSEIGEPTYIAISVADVSKVAPALLEGATIALRYQWPEAGTPVAGGYIAVAQKHSACRHGYHGSDVAAPY